MKKILILSIASLMLLTACNGNKSNDSSESKKTLDGITDLAFTSSDGEVSWTEVKKAKEYEYTVNDNDVFKTQETSINIFDVVTNTSISQLKVRAVNGEAKSEYATLSFNTSKLATPQKGVVSSDSETHEPIITWSEVENASKYLVSVNDKKFVTYHTNVFKPSTEGEYYIKVKCKAYVKNKSIVYLESDVSEKSEVLGFLPGPSLSIDAVNVISWSSDEEFDSYNIYVNGEKIRENVSSPLNLVTGDNPILTKTGEYTIQIEAIKNGVSYWSNIQEEVGTSNINEKEFYSFDNRKFNRVVPSGIDPGWVISNEKSHSEPYSLYIPTQTQVNMQRYASSGINDVDYRKVNKISYWAYIPEIDGYSQNTVKGYNLPSIVYDGWGNSTAHARLVSFAQEKEVPIGEWTQLHFEVENQYDEIVIFGPGSKIKLDDGETEVSVPLYMDDICYDDLDDDNLEFEYKFKYDFELCGHAWCNKPQKLSFGSEFANQLVEISMDICGTASPTGEHLLGFGAFNSEKVLTGLHCEINRSYISTLNYQTFTFDALLDENGDFYTTVYEKDASTTSSESFTIYAKNVTCAASKYNVGTLVESHFNANATYVSILAIPTDIPAGTAVEVTMDVAVKTTGNYSELRTAASLWATEIPNPKYTRILSNSELKESDDWRTIIFDSKVLDAEQINFHNGSEGYTQSFTGNYILVYLHGHLSTDFFYYKPNSISIVTVGSLVSGGNNGAADIYYQSLAGLSVDYPAGTVVSVNMDIYITGTFNQYSGIYWLDTVYSNNLWNNAPKIITGDEAVASAGTWQHISFTATVRNFASCGIFAAVDTSAYGNAVYLLSRQKTEDSLNFKNVQIVKEYESMIPGGNNGNTADTYYQSIAGLMTDLEVGTSVLVEMDVNVTGTFNSYSGIWAANTVYSAAGGELNDKVDITSLVTSEEGWHHISFTATVRNFEALRRNSAYPVVDTSAYGNAVYLLSMNKSVDSFNYKNVVITAN